MSLDQLWNFLVDLLGLGTDTHPLIGQMAVRAVIGYLYALLLVRVGETRFLGSNTAFDVILGFILGSVISRAVTGNAPFFASLVAATVLVGMHWAFAAIAYRTTFFATLVKGDKRVLVKNGEILWDNMRAGHIGERDLEEAMRVNGRIEELDEVEEAYLERNGQISIIRKQKLPRVVEISVQEGVQTVRLEL